MDSATPSPQGGVYPPPTDIAREPGRAKRLRLRIAGAVQGVGFRPFVHRLARSLRLTGFVANDEHGVVVEVEGPPADLNRFLARLERSHPRAATLHSCTTFELEPLGSSEFLIAPSDAGPRPRLSVPPDLSPCPDCLRELGDPSNRRFRYPFINCTQCGPRFSILRRLPYDRHQTTMHGFTMCARCRAEFVDPGNRRFHAQPNACPACGPRLALLDRTGRALARDDDALRGAADAVRGGGILALKGLGGFQLVVDARAAEAVRRLRARKGRPAKPFAIMVPGLRDAADCCEVSSLEAGLLDAPAAPIVLLRRRASASRSRVASQIAPGSPWLGVMLPATPLHHLLLDALGFPVVATSGNRSGEPMAIDDVEALERLGSVADMYLTHDRPIARPVDDSVVRVVGGREMMLRLGRGYAPLAIPLTDPGSGPILGLGGHYKVAGAAAAGDTVILGPHVGDLDQESARASFRARIGELCALQRTPPRTVACDAHPDYYSTRYARDLDIETVPVQHHLAHVVSCATENALAGPVLGVAWDGTGYGDDGSWWGGEFLVVDGRHARRVAHLRPFALPGGERAVAEPRRAALGVLLAAFGPRAFDLDVAPLRAFTGAELRVMRRMLERGFNAPPTTSAGRLFDAVAALLGLAQRVSFEGQAAMALEHLQEGIDDAEALPVPVEVASPESARPWVVDWQPLLERLLAALDRGALPARVAAAFHASLAGAIVTVAARVGVPDVVLSGGCFQNRTLTEDAIRGLRGAGFRPHWPRRVPPNDGGLALGQVAWARRLREEGIPNVSRRAG